MMMCVSAETRAELIAASRAYEREMQRTARTRERLHAAIIAEKREGVKVSDIEDIVPYRRGRVTSILEAAGLTEKRKSAAGGS
jgi:hypothetical protein